MSNLFLVLCVTLCLAWLFMANNRTQPIIDEFSNYGPEYSTNNPEGAPWDISSPFYTSFWGYDNPYYGYYPYSNNYNTIYGW